MKKFYLTINIILCNVFVVITLHGWLGLIKFPEFFTLFFSAAILASMILVFAKSKKKILPKIISAALSIAASCTLICATYLDPFWNSEYDIDSVYTNSYTSVLSYREAKSDLDTAMHYPKKLHPIAKDGLPKEVEAAYNAAVNDLKSADAINVAMLRREIQSVYSVLGDAHTVCGANLEDNRCLKYMQSFYDKRYKLVEVNGVGLDEIFKEKISLFSYESEEAAKQNLAYRFNFITGMYLLGYEPGDGIIYTYEDTDGNRHTYTFTEKDFLPEDKYYRYIRKEKPDEDKYFSYEIDEEKSLAVLTLDACKYSRDYEWCVENMFFEVKNKNIRNVAVDLRRNSGGTTAPAVEFLRYIDVDSYVVPAQEIRRVIFTESEERHTVENDKDEELAFDGNLYVLTSADTFSAAMEFAEYIKDNNLGIIIGEASGNSPNFYAGVIRFVLPESKLHLQISTAYYHRIDSENDAPFLYPDIECDERDVYDVLDKIISEE